LNQGGAVIMIRVPQSCRPPHRVVRQGKGQHRFWARSSAGKYELNVDELRNLFLLAPHLAERIGSFRADRVAKIAAGEVPCKLRGRSCLILHVVPFSAFNVSPRLVVPELFKGSWTRFPPIGGSIATHRVNFDGVLTLTHGEGFPEGQRGYVQIYRNGMVESVESTIASPANEVRPERIQTGRVEDYVIESCGAYLEALDALGIGGPFAVLVTLIGLKGLSIHAARGSAYEAFDELQVIDRDQMHFGEVIFEELPEHEERRRALLPIFDQLANAAGLDRSWRHRSAT
jgi:hypothetical protein